MNKKYIFSGHESFPCKSLWLKKGYDFIYNNNNFNAPDAVVELGVGKNMVLSIRYWLKSFGLTKDENLTELASYLFDNKRGKDKYIEDLGTLWLLHFMLVYTSEACIYNLLFTRFQRERKQFEKYQIQDFIKRYMTEQGVLKLYNENTVKKDIGVFLQNYVTPKAEKSLDDFSSLLLDLNLICLKDDRKTYQFNIDTKRDIVPEIFFYAIVVSKDEEKTIDYDALQELGLMFCMNDLETISTLKYLSEKYSAYINYNEVAGVRQLQFVKEITPRQILDLYYGFE